MPVDLQQLQSLRAQLQRDRELCGSNQTAQGFLDIAETELDAVEASWARKNPIEALNEGLSEIEASEIGRDSVTGAELNEIIAETRECQEVIETVPVENQDTPVYAAALRCMDILKQNAVALANKTDLQDRILGVVESTKHLRAELEEVDRLIQANAELNLGATRTVFQYFRDSLTPALDSVLSRSLGEILTV